MPSLRGLLPIGLLLLLPALALPADKYLPSDTDAVVVINVQQILASPLVKTHYLDPLGELLKSTEAVQKPLAALGVDPLKDVDQVIFSNGESLYRLTKRTEKGKTVYGSEGGYFVLIKGRFNSGRVRAYAEQLAKDKESFLVKTHKVGSASLYEIDVGRTLFVAVPDGSTVAVSSRRELVVEVLEKAVAKRKATPKYKELAGAVAKLNAKQSVGIVVLGSAGFGLDADLKKVGGKVIETPVKQMISEDGVESINGSIEVTDGIRGTMTVFVKGAAAKEAAKSAQENLNDITEAVLRGLFKYPKLGPFAEFIKALSVTVKDNRHVTIQAEVSAKQVAEALK